MKIKRWYRIALVPWMFIGLPIAVIGIGFAGGALFTVRGLVAVFTPPVSGPGMFVEWAIGLLVVFLPIVLLPFALFRGEGQNPQGRGT